MAMLGAEKVQESIKQPDGRWARSRESAIQLGYIF
jgi:hypothetical protein